MTDWIIAIVLLLIIGGAVLYIRKAKRSGVKCIGCPESASCAGNCAGNCRASCKGNCECHSDTQEK